MPERKSLKLPRMQGCIGLQLHKMEWAAILYGCSNSVVFSDDTKASLAQESFISAAADPFTPAFPLQSYAPAALRCWTQCADASGEPQLAEKSCWPAHTLFRPAPSLTWFDQLKLKLWPTHTQLDQLHDQLGPAGWPAHTQLDQLYDQLGPAGWPAHTQLDQLYSYLGHAGWPANTQLDHFITSLSSLIFKLA